MTTKELTELTLNNALALKSGKPIPLYARVESFPAEGQDLIQALGIDDKPIMVISRSAWEDWARFARRQLGIAEGAS